MSDPLASRAHVIEGVGVSKVGGYAFVLRRLRFTDTIARSYRLDLELISTGGDVDVQKVLGQSLTITLPRPGGGERYLNGFVRQVTRRFSEGELVVYALTVVPHLDLLLLGRDHRIFLEKTAKQILGTVFDDLGLSDYDDGGVTADYPQLEQCVQYGETHHAFVHRLMERFGISYHHDHAAGGHTLRLVDSSAEHGPVAGAESLPFRSGRDAMLATEHVSSWESTASMQPGSFSTRDYTPSIPRRPSRRRNRRPTSIPAAISNGSSIRRARPRVARRRRRRNGGSMRSRPRRSRCEGRPGRWGSPWATRSGSRGIPSPPRTAATS